MRRFILTGAPGAGKTAIIHQLEIDGFGAAWLGHPVSDKLSRELERIRTGDVYQKRVFFIRTLGFIAPTEARRISFEDALRFEQLHEDTYRSFGYEIVLVEQADVAGRAAAIKMAL